MLLNEIIRRMDGGYVVLSHDGRKRLSRVYDTKDEAIRRLHQIEWWKNHKG